MIVMICPIINNNLILMMKFKTHLYKFIIDLINIMQHYNQHPKVSFLGEKMIEGNKIYIEKLYFFLFNIYLGTRC